MKFFEEPVIEVVAFSVEDVITTSGDPEDSGNQEDNEVGRD